MEYTYEQLKDMSAAQLKEAAAKIDHDAVHGYSTMHKDHLTKAICEALGIEAHEHHEVVGIDKAAVKQQIRELKKQRDKALEEKDKVRLKRIRRKIHRLKLKLREAMV